MGQGYTSQRGYTKVYLYIRIYIYVHIYIYRYMWLGLSALGFKGLEASFAGASGDWRGIVQGLCRDVKDPAAPGHGESNGQLS